MTLKCEATAALSVFGETPPAALGWTDRRLRLRPATVCVRSYSTETGDEKEGWRPAFSVQRPTPPLSLPLFFPYLAGGLYVNVGQQKRGRGAPCCEMYVIPARKKSHFCGNSSNARHQGEKTTPLLKSNFFFYLPFFSIPARSIDGPGKGNE